MTAEFPEGLTDKTGASVTIANETGDPISAFTIAVDAEGAAGKAEYVDSTSTEGERIFFHTEVDAAFGGRGLAGLLVAAALDDSIRNGLTIVPVCPLFAGHLDKHGEEFVGKGGVFRRPRPADLAQVKDAAARRS